MDEHEPPLLDEDDFEFEPTAHDVALAIGVGVEPEEDRAALDELADAMLVWASGEVVDRLAAHAAAALWNDELDLWVRSGLQRLAETEDYAAAVPELLAGLEREGPDSELARAVACDLAMQLSNHDQPSFLCTCCLDDWAARAEPFDRRRIALQAAVVAKRDAAVPPSELLAALAGMPKVAPAERLATDLRRRAVRARLARLGDLGREAVPTLAAELRTIGGEPLPARTSDDDVWAALCEHLLADVAKPELN